MYFHLLLEMAGGGGGVITCELKTEKKQGY